MDNRCTETGVSSLVGQRFRYFEDGWHAEVTILENTSDREWERYTLRVEKTTQEGIYGAIPDGEVFPVSKKRGQPFGMIWTLAPLA